MCPFYVTETTHRITQTGRSHRPAVSKCYLTCGNDVDKETENFWLIVGIVQAGCATRLSRAAAADQGGPARPAATQTRYRQMLVHFPFINLSP